MFLIVSQAGLWAVCSLQFQKEHLKKSLGIGWLTCINGAVPSVFAWKRSLLEETCTATQRGCESSSIT